MASESNAFIFYIFTFYCLGFYELCAWTRPKSWVLHSQSYGTSVSLTEEVGGFCLSKSSSRHEVNMLTFSERKGEYCIYALSERRQFVHIPWGHRTGHSQSHQEDPWHHICYLGLPIQAQIFLRILQCWWAQSHGITKDERCLHNICVWTLNLVGALSLWKKRKCSIIISKIKQTAFSCFPNIGWIFLNKN